jgi:hypothetical protein
MRSDVRAVGWAWLGCAVFAGAGVLVEAQGAPVPVSTSAAKAKEVASLMQAQKLESFAASETGSKYVAALLIPNVQLLVASAAYGRPTDLEYRVAHKQYMEVYMDLKSSGLAADKAFFEDALADGLVAMPGRNLVADSITTGGERRVFDGDFADPRRKNQKKISQEDYFKAFTAADARYAVVLDVILTALKKGSSLAAPGGVR